MSPLPDSSDYARKMAEVQAAYQAVHAEKLLAGADYKAKVKSEGTEAANIWVSEESKKRTPETMQSLLAEMKAAGWSVDTVRFNGEARPAEIG